jgi:hypothetical protein
VPGDAAGPGLVQLRRHLLGGEREKVVEVHVRLRVPGS